MNFKNKQFWLIVSFIILTTECFGQGVSNIPGSFSESGFGVRPSGMGQAYTAISNDANAFLTNPAGLLLGTRKSFTANYAELFGLVRLIIQDPSGQKDIMKSVVLIK